eukprot:5316477-Pleurochrysis_carterae.AAC.1
MSTLYGVVLMMSTLFGVVRLRSTLFGVVIFMSTLERAPLLPLVHDDPFWVGSDDVDPLWGRLDE